MVALYVGAIVLLGVKWWSSHRGMVLRDQGTLWTTRSGWRVYVLSKATPPLAAGCIFVATAMLPVPRFFLWPLGIWVGLTFVLVAFAVRSHMPRIAAARAGLTRDAMR